MPEPDREREHTERETSFTTGRCRAFTTGRYEERCEREAEHRGAHTIAESASPLGGSVTWYDPAKNRMHLARPSTERQEPPK